MVAADVVPAVPMVDMSLPEADAARVLKKAAVTSGFFYGAIRLFSIAPTPFPCRSGSETPAFALARDGRRHGAGGTQ